MTKPDFAIAIMASGKGTRLKSKRPKTLHEIGGKPLLLHIIAAAARIAPPESIYAIVGYKGDLVRAAVAATGVTFVQQDEPLGTGHAIQQVKAFFQGKTPPKNLLVLSGDVPLIRPETLAAMCDLHLREHAAMTILSAEPEDPFGYGRIVIKKGSSNEVQAIVEQKDLTPAQAAIDIINSGIYAFNTEKLFAQLDKLDNKNSQGEYYLTDIAAMLVTANEKVIAIPADDIAEVLGANTIAEMMALDAALRAAAVNKLMASGVTIFRPETVTIDSGVTVGADTVIEPFVQLLGATTIGSDCRIRSYSVIQNSHLADGVVVRNGCILDGATVATGAVLGPYAHLRPESRIGEGAHVGNFVETKKATLGKGSKANHLSYLGDAVIGSGVNIGAGVITCNYDGVQKNTTTIGDGVFVGSDSTLVAPLTLADGSYVAAGSCITESVPRDALALSRSQQVTKPDWAARRRAKQAAKNP
ncbi:MAG TPA: bifunctional UDP-N-acetylglucosamine diphosphorylase/glucosamine-1-phosphate N-acetyltransferase GlmU [Acidobacteriaceae bacterium]|nr:bifunctional UDP-N-acetylglucosamine diphosphorylase/glucosamine-1-phosphate N-acetyltransferase GlmU [Acidobacteriaceae bacterium]